MTTNIKLNNHSRDQIVSNAMHDAFAKESKAHEARLTKLADKCYRSIVSVAQEKAARQAPESFLFMCNEARLCFTDPETGYSRDSVWSVALSRTVPFPSNNNTLTINSNELHAEYRAIMEEKKDIDNKRQELKHSLKRTVYSTTSLKKLIEMWPEVETFLPANLTAPKPMLPALPVGDLNAALKAAGVKIGVVKPAVSHALVVA
jgi:hypothetical protein